MSFVSLLQGQGGEDAFAVEREWGRAVEAEGITQAMQRVRPKTTPYYRKCSPQSGWRALGIAGKQVFPGTPLSRSFMSQKETVLDMGTGE